MYKYKYTRISTKEPNITKRAYRTGEKEVLVGTIQGKKASDLEERFSRALDKRGIPYAFRKRITSPFVGERKLTNAMASLPGEVEVDFLVGGTQVTPVMVQGEIAHFKTKWQAEIDKEKNYQINYRNLRKVKICSVIFQG